MAKKTIVLTGAHITPALALIDKLKQQQWSIIYFGRKKIEPQLLSAKGVKLINISSGKLQRFNLAASLMTGIKLPLGFFQSLYYFKKIKPVLVVSFGGHIAVPVCLAAKLLKIPFIIHEQTLAAGLANKLVAPFAAKIAIAWPSSKKYFPSAKIVLTGNPIRKELLQTKRSATGSYQPASIYITGGSQGSQTINQAIVPILPQLLKKYFIVHQFGLAQSDKDWRQQLALRQALPSSLKKHYQLKRWFTAAELAVLFKQVDLVVGRAGINTVTELIALNKPALMIPLPYTQKNEQLRNARFLNQLGLAEVLLQKDLTPLSLLTTLNAMMDRLNQYRIKAGRVKPQLVRQGTDKLYQLIVQLSRGS